MQDAKHPEVGVFLELGPAAFDQGARVSISLRLPPNEGIAVLICRTNKA